MSFILKNVVHAIVIAFLCINEYSEYAKINKGGNSGMTPMIIDLEWLIRILMGKK
jgi:hypothetical protein